jgi:hypothetical protein
MGIGALILVQYISRELDFWCDSEVICNWISHLSLTTRVYFSVEYIRANSGVYLRETGA